MTRVFGWFAPGRRELAPDRRYCLCGPIARLFVIRLAAGGEAGWYIFYMD